MSSVETSGNFQALPEDCIAIVLSMTSPKDACRLSLVMPSFRSAAEADAVWERFLPHDYRGLVSRSIDDGDSVLPNFRSKKELYLHLCGNPIVIDVDGRKLFIGEKHRKEVLYAERGGPIYPLGSWPPPCLARLGVGWLDVRCKINTSLLSSETTYVACLVFIPESIKMRHFEPRYANATVGISGKDGAIKRTICLDIKGKHSYIYPILRHHVRVGHPCAYIFRRVDGRRDEGISSEYPKFRRDKWMEVELGELFVDRSEDRDMEINLTEPSGGDWNRGITVAGIEIRPKTNEHEAKTNIIEPVLPPKVITRHGSNIRFRSSSIMHFFLTIGCTNLKDCSHLYKY
ncbi:hypothetical protein OROHE_003114 [Orobanche hederae]